MSFSEPKWREAVQTREPANATAKRSSGIRKIERSLRKCDDLQHKMMTSGEKQAALKTAYKAEVAYRSTDKKLKKFRETFGVTKDNDDTQRLSDKGLQIRMYTKVDRDQWQYNDLREWYNKVPGDEKVFVSAAQDGDSAMMKQNFLTMNTGANPKTHYMLQCGGPHDPSGFLKNVNSMKTPGVRTVSMGTPLKQPHDSRVMSIVAEANHQNSSLPHLQGRSMPPQQAKIEAPHWGHWQKNLGASWNKRDNMFASGHIPKASSAPWALD